MDDGLNSIDQDSGRSCGQATRTTSPPAAAPRTPPEIGPRPFADYEVVELLLTLAIPCSDVEQPAKALIARLDSL